MPRILRMPNRATNPNEDDPASVPSNGNSEYVIRYPRMQRGIHFADFMRDSRMSPEVYHCVIQREGSKEIFSWTQHSSLEVAVKNAELALALIVGPTVAEM